MNYYRLWVCIIIIGIFSCHQEESISFQEEVRSNDIEVTSSDFDHLNQSILDSEWWNLHPEAIRLDLAEDLRNLGEEVTMDQIRKIQAKAIRRGNQMNFRANVCQGYPNANDRKDVILRTQTDVDDFAQLNCSVILGNLFILRRTGIHIEITDLTPLQHVEFIGSGLNISTPALTTLDGLEGIESIGSLGPIGRIYIEGNKLNNIEALSGVNKMHGFIRISNTSRLKFITDAFNNTQFFPTSKNDIAPNQKGGVSIINNKGLLKLGGFNSLDDFNSISIYNNINLLSINGFQSVHSLDHYVSIMNNTQLNKIEGFSSLTSLGLYLQVQDNPSLNECCIFFPVLCSNPPLCSENGIEQNVTFISNNGPLCTEQEILDNGLCN